MNRQIKLYFILIILIFSCSENGSIIISNTPTDLPSQNYKINLHSNSGQELNSVTISWNDSGNDVSLINLSTENSVDPSGQITGLTPGEFLDIAFSTTKDGSMYEDTIQVFTRPVYPVYNFRYNIEVVMRKNGIRDEDEDYVDLGNGEYDEGEEFTDLNADGVWNEGEDYVDFGNGEYDEETEEFDDTENQEKYHRVLKWSRTSEPDENFSNYIIYRADNDNVNILINPEYCECDIATLTKLDTSFTDSMVSDKSSLFDYYYQIRVNSGIYGRNSYIYNYTNFTAPSKVSLVDANVSNNNNDFIQVIWDAVSISDYLYQYEIWRKSNDNADDLRRMAIIVDQDQEKFMDRNVGNGTSYKYSVAVVAINGERVFSDYVTGWSIP